MILLDGQAHAARCAPGIAARAEAVVERRGTPPTLILAAFADADGRVPHVRPKLRAGEATGIAIVPLVFETAATTRDVIAGLGEAVATRRPDGVFVQVPAPVSLDADAIVDAIPPDLDLDIMTSARVDRYMAGEDLPPVTVEAALQLLDAHHVAVQGREGLLIAETTPFAAMFAEALRRRGADVHVVNPSDDDLRERVRAAALVVAAAGIPGIVKARDLAAGAIALDIGYFNAGGRGDIDASHDTAHLHALMPVPGGVGPMTISALLQRVVHFAEHRRQ